VTREADQGMRVVHGVQQLTSDVGPVFVVIGVFDGLHLGHAYLLRHLVDEAGSRQAAPTVITFDHHPDEVLTGKAPPLLLDPRERLDRLSAAAVRVTVVEHFDEALRQTPYDAFVERIRERVDLRGFLMTPDAAFGYERRGTPETLAELGDRLGFDVAVVPPFSLAGRAVRSSEIRSEIAAGNLAAAAELLGRPISYTGTVADEGPDGVGLEFELPLALPPAGEYAGTVDGQTCRLRIDRGIVYLRADVALGALVTVHVTGEVTAALA
jgi:riboflavin kinase / FMN adenylyltransferase